MLNESFSLNFSFYCKQMFNNLFENTIANRFLTLKTNKTWTMQNLLSDYSSFI